MVNFKTSSLSLLAGLSLLACGDSNNGEMHDGAQSRFTAIAVGSTSDAGKSGGETRTFRTSDGLRIDLLAGLINLVPMEIKHCSSEKATFKHAGEDHSEAETTAYFSALDNAAAFIGALALEAGEYCSIIIALQPVHDSTEQPSEGHGDHGAKHGAVDTSFGGHALNVAPCHFFHTAQLSDEEYQAGEYDTAHSCIQVKLGEAESLLELDFVSPVTINAEQHHLLIELMAHYDMWFDGIVMDDLQSVASEQQRLIDNVKSSIHIGQIGFE